MILVSSAIKGAKLDFPLAWPRVVQASSCSYTDSVPAWWWLIAGVLPSRGSSDRWDFLKLLSSHWIHDSSTVLHSFSPSSQGEGALSCGLCKDLLAVECRMCDYDWAILRGSSEVLEEIHWLSETLVTYKYLFLLLLSGGNLFRVAMNLT